MTSNDERSDPAPAGPGGTGDRSSVDSDTDAAGTGNRRSGGRLRGMLICIVIGHVVKWGPCDRCGRRALG